MKKYTLEELKIEIVNPNSKLSKKMISIILDELEAEARWKEWTSGDQRTPVHHNQDFLKINNKKRFYFFNPK